VTDCRLSALAGSVVVPILGPRRASASYADNVASAAPVSLTGRLDSLDLSSGSERTCNIALPITSSTGRSISVTGDDRYAPSYFGETACNQTAQALRAAIQNVVGKVITRPDFPALLR